MPGSPRKKRDLAYLDEIGEEEVLPVYLEQGSVHRMLDELGRRRAKEGEEPVKVSVTGFYSWLRRGGPERKAWWDHVKQYRSELDADQMVDIADSATMSDVQVQRLRVDARSKSAAMRNARGSYAIEGQPENLGRVLAGIIRGLEETPQNPALPIPEADWEEDDEA